MLAHAPAAVSAAVTGSRWVGALGWKLCTSVSVCDSVASSSRRSGDRGLGLPPAMLNLDEELTTHYSGNSGRPTHHPAGPAVSTPLGCPPLKPLSCIGADGARAARPMDKREPGATKAETCPHDL